MGDKEKEFYTATELSELFRVKPITIHRLTARGDLPFYEIGRSKRYRAADVERYLSRCRREGVADALEPEPEREPEREPEPVPEREPVPVREREPEREPVPEPGPASASEAPCICPAAR